MSTFLARIEFPEIVFGFVSPIGADLTASVKECRKYLEAHNYRVFEIKVTNIFRVIEHYITPNRPLVHHPLHKRYCSHIEYGNQLRAAFDDNAILAATAIRSIVRKRNRLKGGPEKDRFAKTAYLIHQFKRKEEIDLLRSVYGTAFFQVSVYSWRGARVNFLSKLFASSENSASTQHYRANAEEIIQTDENEIWQEYGQRVGSIFHNADCIINLDYSHPPVSEQIYRFLELIFSSNCISPTKMEYGMYAAKGAALRTLDLSRQVGAAIFSADGQVISLGSNEVPKAGGGTYWSDDQFDDRDYVRGLDSNDQRKEETLNEILMHLSLAENLKKLSRDERITDQNVLDELAALATHVTVKELANDPRIRDSQLMDALEYGRVVHAEMSALSDAAREGRSVKEATLYSTTFPCHMCAKHIVAAGIRRVVFLEPYPKSLAGNLHGDAIQIEGSDRGKYASFPSVTFEHFFGVTPRRYGELFERRRRKTRKGAFKPYATASGKPEPFFGFRAPSYTQLEEVVIKQLTKSFLDATEVDANGM